MKLLMTTVAALVIAASVFASEPDSNKVALKLVQPTKVQLSHQGSPEGLLTVKVYNHKNEMLVNERIHKTASFAKNYDFSQAAPGKYSILVQNAKGEVENMEFEIGATKQKDVYTKMEKISGNKYKLIVNALHQSDLNVAIYENGNLIFQERAEDSKGFSKVYDLVNVRSNSQIEFQVTSASGFSKLISAR
ncbi:hypothetical protein KI659_14755 [Litoribacter alkaliphilus]|uniref:DUF4397 domain-containing protein n=1 Tax=Litoribacter ruber TaxID=702568 RepID=A0AAP2G5N8_9BACT|nr:hypothetical protein [Litoribacter alkaliphilus]MBS9525276.1 hypothetical protein [Litoribacter alkaliphilus]